MIGLLITLNKTDSETSGNVETNDNMYTVLGYYDDIQITNIYSLNGFAPLSDDENNHSTNSFSIRLVAPTQEDFQGYIDKLSPCKQGFFQWVYPPSNQMPLFSILLLRLTEKQMGSFPPEKNLEKIISYISDNCSSYQGRAFFSIYYCLGSADFAVLCHSSSYDPVFNILYGLREEYGFLSSSFMIPCIKHDAEVSDIIDDNTSLSIRVHFNNDSHVSDFVADLKDKLKENGIADSDMEPRFMSGNSDLLFFPKETLKTYLKLYGYKGLMDVFAQKHDVSFRTTVYINMDNSH